MDKKELALAIDQVCEEKNLTKENVKATIEDALAAAYRKDFGDKKTQNIKVEFDLNTADFKVFDVKEVVEDELKEKYEKIKAQIEKLKEEGKEITPELLEEIQGKPKKRDEDKRDKEIKNIEKSKEEVEDNEEEEEKKFNPRTMISLSDAKQIKKSYKIGDEVITELEVPTEFGRMAAQTAKQVIIQKIRERERETIFDEFKDKVGDLLTGTIQRKEGRVILIDFGNAGAIMLPNDQLPNERYVSGNRMKFYVKSVEQTSKGPEILVSRAHVEFLRKIFKLEVPEIKEGTVVIKSIARDAGARAKVAVMAKEDELDPIGSCIGQRGSRIQTIINELGGEKIDIIEWNEDAETFIQNALAPAKIDKIKIEESEDGVKVAKAYVKEDQYSLAIGKSGQNVRLAAQLVGMKIDIVMEGDKKSTQDTEKPANTENTEKTQKKADTEDTEKTQKTQKKSVKNKNAKKSQSSQS